MKFKVEYGIGSYDIRTETLEFKTKKEAENYAHKQSIEVFQEYEGSYGLRTIEDIVDEDGVDEDEAEDIYNDEREGWIEYKVEPVAETALKKVAKEIKKKT